MKLKLFHYKALSESLTEFEHRINTYLKQAGKVRNMTVTDGGSSRDMVVVLTHEETGERGTQECLVLGWIPTASLETFNEVDRLRGRGLDMVLHLSAGENAKRHVLFAIAGLSGASKKDAEEGKEAARQGSDEAADAGAEPSLSRDDRAVVEGRAVSDGEALHPQVRSDSREEARALQRRSRKRG